ncbi:ORF2 [nege-like virus 1]|nr:ORF2 [nege-like virus 1]
MGLLLNKFCYFSKILFSLLIVLIIINHTDTSERCVLNNMYNFNYTSNNFTNFFLKSYSVFSPRYQSSQFYEFRQMYFRLLDFRTRQLNLSDCSQIMEANRLATTTYHLFVDIRGKYKSISTRAKEGSRLPYKFVKENPVFSKMLKKIKISLPVCDYNSPVHFDEYFNPECVSAWRDNGYVEHCGLSQRCYGIVENITVLGGNLCYGVKFSSVDRSIVYYRIKDDQKLFEQNHMGVYCNSTVYFSYFKKFAKAFSPRHTIKSTKGNLLITDNGYGPFKEMFLYQVINYISVPVFRYICDDGLFVLYPRGFMDVNVFPSPRQCDLHLEKTCLELYRSIPRCPKDFQELAGRDAHFVYTVPVTNDTFHDDGFKIGGDTSWTSAFTQFYGYLNNFVFRNLFHLFKNLTTHLQHIADVISEFMNFLYEFKFTDFMDRNYQRFFQYYKEIFEYSVQRWMDMLSADQDFSHPHYGFVPGSRSRRSVSSWLSKVFSAVITPFFGILLEFIEPIISKILEVLLRMIPYFTRLIDALVPDIENLIQLLFSILNVLGLAFFNLLLHVERKFMLFELVVFYIVLFKETGSNLGTIFLSFLFFGVVGFDRKLPSFFLALLQSDYKIVYLLDLSHLHKGFYLALSNYTSSPFFVVNDFSELFNCVFPVDVVNFQFHYNCSFPILGTNDSLYLLNNVLNEY